MKVSVLDVSKKFGDVAVVRGVTLTIGEGELFFLLGPSGCGKTTLLRLLAGFYTPDNGEIRFDDRLVNGVPPDKRGTGMVFQNYALWPHMTVFDNVAYGLDVRRVPKVRKRQRVEEALATVRMSEYADRTPNQLSGGQQQRVALARALVIQPGVLLLDEPLSNLDAKLRLEMRDEIRRIHRETKLTTVYVTHDQQEALSLADRIAVMRDGQVEQLGAPQELLRMPRNAFVREFLGAASFVQGSIKTVVDAGHVTVATPAGDLLCSIDGQSVIPGQRVTCVIRPNDVIVLEE